MNNWFQPAQVHRLTCDWEFHNIELNVLTILNGYNGGCGVNGTGCGPRLGGHGCGGCGDCCCRPRMNVSWLAGFRYFRFDEDLIFASDDGDGVFNGGLDEMAYNVEVENNLIGFQLGADTTTFVPGRSSLRKSSIPFSTDTRPA